MYSKQNKLLWFTLVELIVVITIIWILSTIWFVSYSGYLTWARDSNRISQLTKLSDSLQIYSASKTLPLPDNKIDIMASGALIAYQWEVWVDVLETIDYTNGGKDPKDDIYYTYYLTKDRNSLQLMALMEEQQSVVSLNTTKTFAQYEDRFPKVYGRKLWVMTEINTNIPIQDVTSIVTVWELDIVQTNNAYLAHISNNEQLEWTGSTLMYTNTQANCKRIKQTGGAWNSWTYTISPAGTEFQVYCDMETQGGWWTAATMLADTTTQNLFDTGNTNKITSITKDISSKWTISDIWRDNRNKNIMIKCITEDNEVSSYEIPFFIYNYSKSDIENLEKDAKESTTFSSSALKWSWNNSDFTLEVDYRVSTVPESFYLRSSWWKCFRMSGSNSIDVKGDYYSWCPGYTSNYVNEYEVSLDLNNYCISFIK